jgi:hypothetical protein
MRRSALEHRIVKWSYSCAVGASLALLGAIAALGQEISRRGDDRPNVGRPEPSLPGAVTTPPEWIGTDAPFDFVRFLAAVPRDRNAAPLYLDAFFEFGVEMAVCFPEGPERDRRVMAADGRMKLYMELHDVLEKDPAGVAPEAIDAVLMLYEPGFRKLADAQRCDRCVFETGLGADALLPQVQSARQVARVASLRVRRAVERRDFDAAIRDVEATLRLVRDLQPRGTIISQLVAAAISQLTCTEMVTRILADPRLRVEHCDRLLKLLLSHDTRSIDGYSEGLRVDYLIARTSLGDIDRDHPQLAGQSSPAEHSRRVRDLKSYYRTLLGYDGLHYAPRFAQIATMKLSEREEALVGTVAMTAPDVVAAFSQSTGRMIANLRATECMIVMRRWQLKHRGLPRALAVPIKEAGLKAIPIDPYDGQPMRVALLGSPPVVYSVGKDGRDDGGQQDSKYDTQPGDLLYRMPPVQATP